MALTKEQVEELDISYCSGCHSMTHSIKEGKGYRCGKCKGDKTVSDIYWYETMKNKGLKMKCPRCKGKLWMSIEKGASPLGEDVNKNYNRYNCDKCKLFWGKGDLEDDKI